MKFTLVCDYGDGPKITYEFENIMLSDTLDNIQNFLKGCGFVFDGMLEIVDENEPMQHDLSVDLAAPEGLHKSYRNEDIDADGRC
jgi:hypothetical protein